MIKADKLYRDYKVSLSPAIPPGLYDDTRDTHEPWFVAQEPWVPLTWFLVTIMSSVRDNYLI